MTLSRQEFNRSVFELRAKVECLCQKVDLPVDNGEFLNWLVTYSKQAQMLLHPDRGEEKMDSKTIRKELKQFQISQKVVDFAHKHKIILRKGDHYWWLSDDRTGYIQGLEDQTRGWPRITNGIDVWIELPDGEVFMGHRDWLKYDRRPKDFDKLANAASEAAVRKPSKKKVTLTANDIRYAQALIENESVQEFAVKYVKLTGRVIPREYQSGVSGESA